MSVKNTALKSQMVQNSLAFFRRYWIQYTIVIVLRTLFAAFTMIMTLAFYQLSLDGSAGTKALAAVFSLGFLLGLGILAAHACYIRLRGGNYAVNQDRMLLVPRKKFNLIPYLSLIRMSTLEKSEQVDTRVLSIPWLRLHYHDHSPDRITVHQDELYIQRYGWLSARYGRTRWWFFAVYLAYQLFRAAIVGGGSSTPTAQVYLLLVYDVLAFFIILTINPFEGRRNTVLVVWMLGISKILTTALSIAFLPAINVNRFIATAIGIAIIVVQGLLTIGVMILVVLGVVSSYLSITRDREPSNHGELHGTRGRYFSHLQARAVDLRATRADKKRLQQLEKEDEMAPTPPEPSFTVKSVKRVSKIYDEDDEVLACLNSHNMSSNRPRPLSIRSTHSSLPRGARAVRASWSSQNFVEWDALSSKIKERPESGTAAKHLSSYSGHGIFRSKLSPFQEENDADREMASSASGSESLKSKRPLTPASGKASSGITVTTTPATSLDGDSSLIREGSHDNGEERKGCDSYRDDHSRTDVI